MIYKMIVLLAALSSPAFAETLSRQEVGLECLRQCAQDNAFTDTNCKVDFKKCTESQGNAADLSAQQLACDMAQAVCLTDSNSALLACQLDCSL